MDKGSNALITGGSGGIGLELARLFARDGYRLLLVSLPKAELEAGREKLKREYPDTDVLTLRKDLSRPEAAREVFDWTRELGLEVDVLVNNAGFGTYGYLQDISVEREAAMIRLHVETLYRLTRLFLEGMLARDRGRILNLSSISAFQPNPLLATYGATKAFVLQFSRSLAFELREQGSRVRVTASCPTPVKQTGFQRAADMEDSSLFSTWMTTTPDVVAQDSYRALMSGRELVIPGKGFQWLHGFLRLLPTPLLTRISKEHQKPEDRPAKTRTS